MSERRRPPKLKDIAERVGVSESAASLALSGKPGVSTATRERILAVAEEMQWEPNYAAQVLSGASTGIIGLVIIRDLDEVGSEAFFFRFLTGLEEELSIDGYALLLQVAKSIQDETEIYRKWRSARKVDAVVLVDLRTDDIRPQVLKDIGLPAIITGAADPHGYVPSLRTDDAAALEQVVSLLGDLNHRDVAYVCGDPQLTHILQRVIAFKEAVGELGGEPRVLPTDFSADRAAAATEELLKKRPSAIIFDNEILALAGMGVIRAHGLDVPGDISVVVCEDSVVAEVIDPPLTALQRDAFSLGRQVARRLLDHLADGDPAPRYAPVPTIAMRKSVAQLKHDEGQ